MSWQAAGTALAGFVLLTVLHTWRAPFGYVNAVPIPDAYDVLARERRAVVAHFDSPTPIIGTVPRIKILPPASQPIVETEELSIYRLRWERIPEWP